ncbi:MAG: hypothetical protein ACP5TL_02635 [Candidatus Micrarchaeia archaeon]
MLSIADHRISLDKLEADSTIDFISHAHSDHIAAAKHSNNILASKETIDLLNALGIDAKVSQIHAGIELLPAGHILGSRQLYVYDSSVGLSYLYSGDFQMQKSMASEGIKTKNADILVIDSTYPDPKVSFGVKEETIESLLNWTSRTLEKGSVLFSAYAVGKAQEIIAIMNQIGIIPVVTKKISVINSIYKKNGVQLDYVSAYDGSNYEEHLNGNFVGISEQRNINELAYMLENVYGKKFYTAMVTGFASFIHFNTDAQFSLSDHADFAQSIDYINEVNPKIVLTYGHNAEKFAINLSKLGYTAQPFNHHTIHFAEPIIARGDKKTKEYIY